MLQKRYLRDFPSSSSAGSLTGRASLGSLTWHEFPGRPEVAKFLDKGTHGMLLREEHIKQETRLSSPDFNRSETDGFSWLLGEKDEREGGGGVQVVEGQFMAEDWQRTSHVDKRGHSQANTSTRQSGLSRGC
jgi:hypothetical protein